MNINNITFESFKEIYEYLVYKRQNINKFIQNNEDYTNFMNNLQKKYSSIEDTDDYLYYHKLISNMEKQFMCKKTTVDLNLQKINLIIDTFDTFEKMNEKLEKKSEDVSSLWIFASDVRSVRTCWVYWRAGSDSARFGHCLR